MSAQPSPAELRRRLLEEVSALGFDHCRICPIDAAPHGDFFTLWLEAGRAGAMRYLERAPERRRFPLLHSPARDGAGPFRSVIVLGANYSAADPTRTYPPELAHLDDPAHGRIAAYAWGRDYHEPLRRRLYSLDAALRTWSGRTTQAKALVDTGPVLERDWAARSGMGFTGKNCCTIHPVEGSWLFLATLLVPELLEYDPPPAASGPPEPTPPEVLAGLSPAHDYGTWEIPLGGAHHTVTCGRCTRCLDACPTGAFVGPFHLNPQRCISYWTIETQAPIPRELRPAFGNRIFGCDVCQSVCPWNQRLPAHREVDSLFRPEPGQAAPPLLEGFGPDHFYWLDDEAFELRFRDTPILRATRPGMLRNVCVALGNEPSPLAISALALALGDPHPAPRGHAAWALGRLRTLHGDVAADLAAVTADELLRDRLATEEDVWVREEISAALATLPRNLALPPA